MFSNITLLLMKSRRMQCSPVAMHLKKSTHIDNSLRSITHTKYYYHSSIIRLHDSTTTTTLTNNHNNYQQEERAKSMEARTMRTKVELKPLKQISNDNSDNHDDRNTINNNILKPKASNLSSFSLHLSGNDKEPKQRERKRHSQQQHLQQKEKRKPKQKDKHATMPHYEEKDLKSQNNHNETSAVPIPRSCWVKIDNVPPISSLDSILFSVQNALDLQQQQQQQQQIRKKYNRSDDRTIGHDVIQDKGQKESQAIDRNNSKSSSSADTNYSDNKWVISAKVVLSPYGRPTGWLLRFKSPSIVYNLLNHIKQNGPLFSSWKEVNVKEWVNTNDDKNKNNTLDFISDSVVRVENCHKDVDENKLLHVFSRYELSPIIDDNKKKSCVVRFHNDTYFTNLIGKKGPPPKIFLVSFASPSWARAAIRDKQSFMINGEPLSLTQYPKQIL